MSKRFHIVAKAKLKKKAQADREAKKRKRPRLPWKKASDSAGQSLGAITEMSFKDYLNEAKYYKSHPDDWSDDVDENGVSVGVCPACGSEARYVTDRTPRGLEAYWMCMDCGHEQPQDKRERY